MTINHFWIVVMLCGLAVFALSAWHVTRTAKAQQS
jgi:hypothetical protein